MYDQYTHTRCMESPVYSRGDGWGGEGEASKRVELSLLSDDKGERGKATWHQNCIGSKSRMCTKVTFPQKCHKRRLLRRLSCIDKRAPFLLLCNAISCQRARLQVEFIAVKIHIDNTLCCKIVSKEVDPAHAAANRVAYKTFKQKPLAKYFCNTGYFIINSDHWDKVYMWYEDWRRLQLGTWANANPCSRWMAKECIEWKCVLRASERSLSFNSTLSIGAHH